MLKKLCNLPKYQISFLKCPKAVKISALSSLLLLYSKPLANVDFSTLSVSWVVWQSLYFAEHVRRAPKLKSKSFGMLLPSSNTPTSVSLHCIKARHTVKWKYEYCSYTVYLPGRFSEFWWSALIAVFSQFFWWFYGMFCILTLGETQWPEV
jgi:hypothetical protein